MKKRFNSARLAGQLGRALWIGDSPGGNYTEGVLRASAGLAIGAHVIEVRHDDNCAIFRASPCNCEPDVSVASDGAA